MISYSIFHYSFPEAFLGDAFSLGKTNSVMVSHALFSAVHLLPDSVCIQITRSTSYRSEAGCLFLNCHQRTAYQYHTFCWQNKRPVSSADLAAINLTGLSFLIVYFLPNCFYSSDMLKLKAISSDLALSYFAGLPAADAHQPIPSSSQPMEIR